MKKLKPVIFSILLCLPAFFAVSQMSSLRPVEHFISGQIDLAADKLIIDTTSTNDFKVELKDGEIIISFPLNIYEQKLNKNIQKKLPRNPYFQVKLFIELDSVSIYPVEENLKGDIGDKIPLNEYGEKQIIWTNLVETFQQLKGNLSIKVETTIKGEFAFDCSNPPTFSNKEKTKYYIAAGVGAGLIGVGQYYRLDAQKIYKEKYKKSSSKEEAKPFFDKANNQHHTYLILTYTGVAILVADAFAYFFKVKNDKSELKIFENFCREFSLEVQPTFEVDPTGAGNSYSGVQLTFTF